MLDLLSFVFLFVEYFKEFVTVVIARFNREIVQKLKKISAFNDRSQFLVFDRFRYLNDSE